REHGRPPSVCRRRLVAARARRAPLGHRARRDRARARARRRRDRGGAGDPAGPLAGCGQRARHRAAAPGRPAADLPADRGGARRRHGAGRARHGAARRAGRKAGGARAPGARPRPVPPQISLPIEVVRGGVTVRAEPGVERLAGQVAKEAAPALQAIAEDLRGLPIVTAVEIRLVKRAEDLSRAAPGGRRVPEWAIGVAFPDEGVVVVAYRNGPMPADVGSVVTHELAHMALGAALGDRAPRWLHEGFAYLHSSDFSLDRTRTLTGMAWSGDVIPLADLDRSFPAQEIAAARAYAQSYDLVSYLARRGRSAGPDDDGNRWPFRRFLAAIAAGVPIDDAAVEAYSADLRTLF